MFGEAIKIPLYQFWSDPLIDFRVICFLWKNIKVNWNNLSWKAYKEHLIFRTLASLFSISMLNFNLLIIGPNYFWSTETFHATTIWQTSSIKTAASSGSVCLNSILSSCSMKQSLTHHSRCLCQCHCLWLGHNRPPHHY